MEIGRGHRRRDNTRFSALETGNNPSTKKKKKKNAKHASRLPSFGQVNIPGEVHPKPPLQQELRLRLPALQFPEYLTSTSTPLPNLPLVITSGQQCHLLIG